MIDLLKKSRLVIATHNEGKRLEMQNLLAPLGLEITSSGKLGLPEPEETGTTFRQNAALKAESASALSGLPALSDDSGLVIPALMGSPGIYSARWAGPNKDFAMAMARIEKELAEKNLAEKKVAAAFVCTLALSIPGEKTHCFSGEVLGSLSFPPRGTQGFGYDPIFVPGNETRTFGEMSPEEKDRISHRADAFANFFSILNHS